MTPADIGWLEDLHRDPEVMAYFGGIREGEANDTWVANHLKLWDDEGMGVWILRLAESGEAVGRGAIRPMTDDVRVDITEIGYTFARHAWGFGYATEAAQALVALGFDHYGLGELGAIAHVHNLASNRVLVKAGFSRVPDLDVTLAEGAHFFYRYLNPGL